MVGECSATCGEGTLEKHRFELVPAMFGGVPCEGDALVVESCNNGDCPGKRFHLGFPHLYMKDRSSKKCYEIRFYKFFFSLPRGEARSLCHIRPCSTISLPE